MKPLVQLTRQNASAITDLPPGRLSFERAYRVSTYLAELSLEAYLRQSEENPIASLWRNFWRLTVRRAI